MAANFDVVIYHGLPIHDQVHLLKDRLGDLEAYNMLYPSKIFDDNPGFGVRDITNKVVSLLRQRKKVIVEDSSASGAIRDSLLRVIKEKIPRCCVLLMHVVPKYGQLQALWDREFCVARSNCDVPLFPSDETFEVPALFLQWECAVDAAGQLVNKMATICQNWSKANLCGRILFICDGCSVARGLTTSAQERRNILHCIQTLVKTLDCPVYVLQIVSVMEAGDFCVPPNPGTLAFLQRRHLLNLHHRNTVYVYNDSKHMKMAEQAGVRHIEMSGCHGTVSNPVPQMLQQMQVLPDGTQCSRDSQSLACIPLADRADELDDSFICMDHPRGHREYVFAKDLMVLKRFQALYRENATPAGEPDSRLPSSHSVHQRKVHRDGNRTTAESQTPDMVREIPKWMVGRGDSGSSHISTQGTLEKSSSTSSTEGHVGSRRTVYIMTEKELLETAKEILRQAGREDLFPVDSSDSKDARDAPVSRKRHTSGSSVMKKIDQVHSETRTSVSHGHVTEPACQAEAVECSPKKKPKCVVSDKQDLCTPAHSTSGVHSSAKTVPVEPSSTSHNQVVRSKPAPDLSILDEIFS
ncbi:hypothetical protein BaRGS_00000092 [Batillaria attramentaria]|uniref:Uncharacterized protein n=1 Tax=Batillaria attramentaria TaxID=370345 RepID=A0ABD0MB23_9CAEN